MSRDGFEKPRKVWSDYHPVSILYRLQRQVRFRLERRWPRVWVHRRMLKGVGRALSPKSNVQDRLKRFSQRTPFAPLDVAHLISDSGRDKLLSLSENHMQHKSNLLGSGFVDLGKKIKWHDDHVTGFRWDPDCPYSTVRSLTPEGADLKRPWELSRCQHLTALGLAERLTGDRSYHDEFIAQVRDWIRANPVGFGINWACPMEVAIRAVNWLVAYSLFTDRPSSTEWVSFQTELTTSLWEHARFLETHLEWNGPCSIRRANHFLANLTGLFTLGILFSDTPSGRRWLKFSKQWLEKEMRAQVLADGVHFECSTSYHRLCLEMFLWCGALGTANSIEFSAHYNEQLYKMQAFACAYTRPDGRAPLFGDNDDGRLLASGLLDVNDHTYLWRPLNDGRLMIDAALLYGGEDPAIEAKKGLTSFREAGYFVIHQNDAHLVVRAGRLAHLGAHAHCDQSSFELSLHGRPIFVDRGTFVYTSDIEKRNLYRSTQAHNVISINDQEQNRATGRAFGFLNDTRSTLVSSDDQTIRLKQQGFAKLNRQDLLHERRFRFANGGHGLRITDTLSGTRAGDVVRWYFHLSPGLTASHRGHCVAVECQRAVACKLRFPSGLNMKQYGFRQSPSYGRLQEATTLAFDLPVEVASDELEVEYHINWDD